LETLFLISIRNIELYLAIVLGQTYSWLKGGWRPTILRLAIISIAVSAAEYLLHQFYNRPEVLHRPDIWVLGIETIWWKVLIIFALITVVSWAWLARKRFIVEPFSDYIDGGSAAKGLSTLLMVNVAQLRDLYSVVDEQRAIPTEVGENSPIDTTIKVEDVSEFLQNAVSAESELSIGPLKIPIHALIATAGRALQGPRILGNIHKTDGRLILTALLAGGKNPAAWRVDNSAPPDGSEDHPINPRTPESMVTELAYRIFTDLALSGTVRWKATYYFCEGLRAYRDCLRTPVDRKLKLRQAEQHFIEALAEDEQMYHAYHNLAVVYTELDQPTAAESAFLKAISHNPENRASYYGLAMNLYERGRYEDAIRLCDHIISMSPRSVKADDLARAYDLKGLAERLLRTDDVECLNRAIESRAQAVKYAWRALCGSEFGRKNTSRITSIVCYCLCDLAVAYAYKAELCTGIRQTTAYLKAIALLRQALDLSPSDYELHYQLGRIYFAWKKYGIAAAEFKTAMQINSGEMDCWASLSLALACAGDHNYAHNTCSHILKNLSEASDEALDNLKETCEMIGDKRDADYVGGIREIRELEETCHGTDSKSIACMEERLQKYGQESLRWQYAMVSLNIGRKYLDAGQPDKARQYLDMALQSYEIAANPEWESSRIAINAGLIFSDLGIHDRAGECFRMAIDNLRSRFPQEIRTQGLETMLARALRNQGRYFEALQHAEKAALREPVSSFEQDELGKIYFAIGDYHKACAIWEGVLVWSPDDPYLHEKIGNCYRHIAGMQLDIASRNSMLNRSVQHLEQALGLYRNDDEEERIQVLYWLGHIYFNLRDIEKTTTNFTIVQSWEMARLNATLGLGEVYLWKKDYDKSERQLWQLIQEAEGKIQEGTAADQIIGASTGDPLYMCEAMAWAYYFLAISSAEKGTELDRAPGLIGQALTYIEIIPDANLQRDLRTTCKGGTGWIRFKQGNIDEAIDLLSQVLSIRTDVETCLRLAEIYWQKSLSSERPLDRQNHFSQAYAFLRQAKSLDVYGEYSRDTDRMLRIIGVQVQLKTSTL